MMMIVLFTVLSRNKLRVPLEGTYWICRSDARQRASGSAAAALQSLRTFDALLDYMWLLLGAPLPLSLLLAHNLLVPRVH